MVNRRWASSGGVLRVGEVVNGFEVGRREEVPEKNLSCFELRHLSTGARHLHVHCADSNNTFAVAFLTVPSDSTGVAHILEHTALCGSHKYPVRDPFFNMLKRSLNTFMNAFTGADWTMYPFSTQNAADFRNLLSVYLDATFRPNLERLDFLQEGHRLEFDDKGKLTRTGVVFNEMHGALSDASSLFREQISARLYPDTTYGQNSGGDPEHIPDLTWEQLRAFHARHYHPSNAFFYTYGNLPVEHHLQLIDEALQGFSRSSDKFVVPMQAPFPQVLRAQTSGPPTPGSTPGREHKSMLVWALPDPSTNVELSLAMHILSELLLSGPSAPLYQALLESGLGSGYGPMTGYEPYNKQPSFGVGVTGASEEDANRLQEVVRATLTECVRNGFPEERVDAILHQLELSHKHVTSGFGLNAGMGAVLPWMHGGDPIASLRFDPWIKQFREKHQQGRYLEDLIQTRLLDNAHCVFAIQEPAPQYSAELRGREEARLAELERKLSPAEREAIAADAAELKRRQNAPPNVDCLPTLTQDDIPRTKERTEIKLRGGVRVAVQPTNGLCYLNASIDLSELPESLMPALPLWCSLLPSQGAAGKDYRDFAQEIELTTGGLSLSPSLSAHPEGGRFQVGVSFHGHALTRNVDKLISVTERMLQQPDWSDRDNLVALLQQSSAGVRESLTQSGHSYAAKTAAAAFGRQHALSEMWNGMTQVGYLSRVAQDPQAHLDGLLNDFHAIGEYVRKAGIVRAQVNAEEGSSMSSLLLGVQGLWKNSLQPDRFVYCEDTSSSSLAEPRRLFFPVPSQVNFVAQCFPTGVSYSHEDMAALQIGAKVMSSSFLHREIREKGGAYGGGCSVSSDLFTFTSYRDPRLEETLGTFQEAFRWLFSPGAFGDRDVLEAKLSIFAGLDKPVPPHSKGLGSMSGITHEMRQEHRNRLLQVDREKILNAFANHVLPRVQGGDAVVSVAALGNDQLSPQGWTVKRLN